MLTRLGELSALVLNFVEQPDIFDCDYRLISEGGQQLDLLIRIRPDGSTTKAEDADWYSLPHERDAKHRSEADNSLRIG